jgi:endonuclease/exonuclease/phosphatase (EEP) superfamily protein YafD
MPVTEPTGTPHVADLLTLVSEHSAGLIVLGWIALVGLNVYALARVVGKRRSAARAGRVSSTTQPQAATAVMTAGPPALTAPAQIERLFGILETGAASAERAMTAHVAAAKHLDSAEYQLQRLFVEFPILTANRPAPAPQPVQEPAPATPAAKSQALAA